MKIESKKILIITGPTSTGKTDLAIKLAKKLNGEIIACDSRQVYTGLDLGTGKLPGQKISFSKYRDKWIMDGIPIYLYDVISPKQKFDVDQYIKKVEPVIKKILSEEKMPIIVGGTGFYLKALVEGVASLSVPQDTNLRKELESYSLEKLQESLRRKDIKKWQSLNESDQKNKRRLIRHLEILNSGKIENSKKSFNLQGEDFSILKIGLTASREKLYERSDDRVNKRIELGMIEEAEGLLKDGLSLNRMKELGLEYGILAMYLNGEIKKEEISQILKYKIHGFIRRQLTWFKKEKDIIWFDITNKSFYEKVEKEVFKWYHQTT